MQIPGRHVEGIEINKEDIFEFRNGIPGFEQFTQYVVFPHDDSFSILQSVKDEDLAFIIANPFLFFEDYEFELSENDLDELEITGLEDIVVRSIVTWGEDLSKVTANLMAPIILNAKKKRGKQIVLYPTTYKSKHPLLKENPGLKGREA